MFLAKAQALGLLVPIDWGTYRVADAATLRALSLVASPWARRLVAWARTLPEASPRPLAFLGPRLWRDTRLLVVDPMPILRLSPRDRWVDGVAPQWNAFFADLGTPPTWRLVAGDETLARVVVPNRFDTVLILRGAADPRWLEAALKMDSALPRTERRRAEAEARRLFVAEAPRGRRRARIGLGPPHRRRLLGPPSWMRTRVAALEVWGRMRDA